MKHSTGKPTKAQRARFLALQDMGCAACSQRGVHRPAEIHHLVRGGRRLGHDFTIPLCAWCHRGVPDDGLSVSDAELILGPSLARSKRDFVRFYGSEIDLLVQTDAAIRSQV